MITIISNGDIFNFASWVKVACKENGVSHTKRIICHGCNNIGRWGAGFSGVLSSHYPDAEKEYRQLKQYNIGSVHFVDCKETIIGNIITQKGIRSPLNVTPFDITSFQQGFKACQEYGQANKLSIHMPKIGAGLGGGNWDEIFNVIQQEVLVPTFIYYLK